MMPNWLVPVPVVLPLLVAAGLVGAAPVCRRWLADVTGIATSALVSVACIGLVLLSAQHTLVYWFGGWRPRGEVALGISFVIDPIGAGLASLSGLLVTGALVFSWRYFDAIRTYFHALMLIFLAAMNGFALTGDLFNLFVFFELMSVSAYALTGYKVEEPSALEGAINFAVTNSIGSFALLLGIALLYGRTGALNLAQIGKALATIQPDAWLAMSTVLIFVGLFVKSAVVPFHFWLPDAHAVAPTPVCMLFSGVMVEMGLYGAFRLYWILFQPALASHGGRVPLVFISIGTLTAVWGAIMCYSQRHLKRLLAFSTMSHVGMMLVGAGTVQARGVAGVALYLLGHAFVKSGLFVGSGLLLHVLGDVDEIKLRGRGRRLPYLGAVFLLGGLGLAGFPPYGTYLGKALMEEAGRRGGYGWVPWLFMFASALTGAAVLRAAGGIFRDWGPPAAAEAEAPTEDTHRETNRQPAKPPVVMLSVAAVLVLTPILSSALTVLPGRIQAAADRFVDQKAYVDCVLNGRDTGPIRASESTHPTANGLIFGFGTATLAMALAGLALVRHRIVSNSWRQKTLRCVRPVLQALHQLQSGHVADYVVWQMVGMLMLGLAVYACLGGS